MKQSINKLLLCLFLFCIMACKKDPSPPPEANLIIAMNPNPGTSVVPALSASYAFKLLINSAPPANGVRIDITGIKDSDNSTAFSQNSQTSNNTVNSVDLQLSNLIAGVLYSVKVDVTSLTTPTNKASLTFKVARK